LKECFMALKIGALAARTGTNAPTIRYYESIGLLPCPGRRAGGQPTYGEEDVRRLAFVRRCRGFSFPIEQVRTLASVMQDPGRSCMEARDVAQERLTAVRAKLVELKALERSLVSFVISCDTSCAGGPGPACVILEDRARPTKRATPRHARSCA
jgi:DNA-binding transcriptional MerR regulator